MLAPVFSALAGCAKSGSTAFDDGDGGTDSGGNQFVAGEGGISNNLPACGDDNKDVFVIAEDRTLYSFHPPTAEFKNKGIIACPTGGASPTSMAVDRSGVAWVRHSDGSVWRVDTATLACDPTDYQPQAEAFTKFGMGFATETNGGQAETLYVSDNGGAGLAKINTKTLGFEFIGPYTGTYAGITSELTGTGEGKLFGFFITSPATVAEISKSTGDVVVGTDHVLTGVYAGSAWAFSFYGGDFYIYTNQDSGSNLPMNATGSTVTKYSPADGSITTVKANVGFKIVGAGVSTCAPTTTVR